MEVRSEISNTMEFVRICIQNPALGSLAPRRSPGMSLRGRPAGATAAAWGLFCAALPSELQQAPAADVVLLKGLTYRVTC